MVAVTSRQFNQDASGAKRATETGPVFITDRGRPAHVLMTIEDYRRLEANKKSIIDMLVIDDDQDIDLELPPRVVEPDRHIDFF